MNPSGKSSPALSVIIPVHNEAGTLGGIVERLTARAAQFAPGLEIIIIDDGSTDRSAAILDRLALCHPIRVIRHPHRLGTGAARKRGHSVARGRWLAWIDADGTYDPEDIFHLWDCAAEGVDQIIGARPHPFKGPQRWRNLLKRIIFKWASWRFRRPIPDLNSGLRLIRREAARTWESRLPDGFSCASTATLQAFRHGQTILFHGIAYHTRPPNAPSKFHPVLDTWRMLKVVTACPVLR
ncbi:glycosyltransferase family 2 protein [Oscillatoria amoena NRMC-F 0135]|nr:glycosyltransferase family 2 protein [Oscillatoria laete-virens]MDL5046571.1 glycosyltransferase family 2 protein [Oscillatoria amoena NRMC-F 0135]MDL5053560.1 glycosyltransferase family 2 protein [Oscillatoria laete-virens NRMC-F 0139]